MDSDVVLFLDLRTSDCAKTRCQPELNNLRDQVMQLGSCFCDTRFVTRHLCFALAVRVFMSSGSQCILETLRQLARGHSTLRVTSRVSQYGYIAGNVVVKMILENPDCFPTGVVFVF